MYLTIETPEGDILEGPHIDGPLDGEFTMFDELGNERLTVYGWSVDIIEMREE